MMLKSSISQLFSYQLVFRPIKINGNLRQPFYCADVLQGIRSLLLWITNWSGEYLPFLCKYYCRTRNWWSTVGQESW